MRTTVKVLGLFMVVFLAVGLVLPSIAADKPGSPVDSDTDPAQGDPITTGPGEASEESNEEMNNSGGGANNNEQNREGEGIGEQTGF